MSQTVLLTREPVVNKNRAITANRLVAHGPNIATVLEGLSAIADIWPSHHTVFLCLGRLVPTPEILQWELPPNVLLEIPAPTLNSPLTQALLPQLKEAGFGVCLSWYQPGTVVPPEVDWRFVLTDVRKTASPKEVPGIALAWGLSDVAHFRQAVDNGYDGASGWFFLKSDQPPRELSPGHAQIVRLLNLVRNNADIKDIEAVLKQDVALSYKLLRYINSAGFGLSCEIQSFRHAVTILGFANLNKWLSLLLVGASKDPSAPALMQAAIARGRFMEEVGTPFFDKTEKDNLFITGAFSLLHILLGTAMSSLLEEMNLPEGISDALLNGEGPYGPFLQLARCCEGFDPGALQQQLDALHIEPAIVNRALVSGLAFADGLQT